MKVKAIYRLENVDNVMATLTMTMSIRDWKDLGEQLASKYPSWKVGNKIGEMISMANDAYQERCESND